MEALYSLYKDVENLKPMIDRNFDPQDGELLPKDPMVQTGIILDCYRKESALVKALENSDIYNAFVNYKMIKQNKTSGPSR